MTKRNRLAKRPHRFNVLFHPAFEEPTCYTVHDAFLRRTGAETQDRQTRVRNADWYGFWRFADFIELWDWKQEYSSADLDLSFRDRISWNIDIALISRSDCEATAAVSTHHLQTHEHR